MKIFYYVAVMPDKGWEVAQPLILKDSSGGTVQLGTVSVEVKEEFTVARAAELAQAVKDFTDQYSEKSLAEMVKKKS